MAAGIGGINKRIFLVNRINKIIYSNHDFQRTFEAIYKELKRCIRLNQAGITLADALGENFVLHFLRNDNESKLKIGQIFPMKGTIIGAVIKSKRAKLIGDLATEISEEFGRTLVREAFRSAIIVPLYLEGTVVGTFHIACKLRRKYSESDLELIDQVKRQISLALENSHLSEMLRRRLSKLSRINRINQKASRIIDFTDLFNYLVKEIKNVFDSKEVFVIIGTKRRKEYIFQTTNHSISKIRRARSKHLTRAHRNMTSQVFSEQNISRDYFPILPRTKSALRCPLKINHDLVGEILIESDKPSDFDKEDLYLVQLIPSYLSFVIKNAQMHERIKVLNRELRAKNSQLVVVNTRLKSLYQEKSNLLNFLSHELKSPLMAVRGYIGLLGRGDLGDLNVQQEEAVRDISQICNRLLELSNSTLNHAKLESYVLTIKALEQDVSVFINYLVKDFSVIAHEKNLKLKLQMEENLPRAFFDSEKIELVLRNLLDNAIKFSRAGGLVQIAVAKTRLMDKIRRPELKKFFPRYKRSKIRTNCEFVEVSVTDTGPIIPKIYNTKIFDQYFQIPGASNANGLGFGLYLSKQIIQAHNGYIWVEDTPQGENKFAFMIPIRAVA